MSSLKTEVKPSGHTAVQRMRKEHMSFKAAPVRHFKDVTNTVEQAELTLPKTPKLATRARAEQNSHAQPEPSYGC